MPRKKTVQPPPSSGSKSPDWSYWGNLATVSLREALQLSLGLNPHMHVPASEGDISLREQYWNRLMISKNHAPEADWVAGKVIREKGDISPEYTEVYLKKFAEWIVNDTTLEPFPREFRRLTENEKNKKTQQPQNEVTPSTKPRYLLLNGDKNSEFYFASQPLKVLEDFLRYYGGNKTKAASAHNIQRQHLAKVICNLRRGKSPWSER